MQTGGQRQGINAISVLSNNGGFWYHVFTERFNGDKFVECLKDLGGRINIFIVPPYAPDINPNELVWNYIRQIGASRTPLKQGESLKEKTFINLELIRKNVGLVKSFFQNSAVSFAAD